MPSSRQTKPHRSTVRPSLILIGGAFSLLALGRCACEEAGTSCQTSSDCPTRQVCVEEQCRVACNSVADCAEGEACVDGACLPGRPTTDAAVIDASAVDRASPDTTAPDHSVPDSSGSDAAVLDSGAPDIRQADASADAAALDAAAADVTVVDTTVVDGVAPDINVPDAYSNSPPLVEVAVVTPATYPSAAGQAFPAFADITVIDAEGDSPYDVEVVGGDPGCSIQSGDLVFTPPPGFYGPATCTVQATDSGAPPATSDPVDVHFDVFYPYVSCHWIHLDPYLTGMNIGVADGLYPIDPDGVGDADPFDAWCDMTTDGGGWTLALRARSAEAVGYDDLFWTDARELFSASPSPRYGASQKYQPFHAVVFSEVLIGMVEEAGLVDPNDPNAPPDPNTPAFAHRQLDISGASLLATFVQDDFISTRYTTSDRDAWIALLPGTTLQNNCNAEGLSWQHVQGGRRLRIGISSNNENDCESNDSSIGIGAAGSQADVLKVGVDTRYNPSSGSNESSIPAFAVVYLRDSAIVTQTTRASCMAHLLAGETADGLYPIDLGGAGGGQPLVSACAMDGYGGGWTLIAGNGDWGHFDLNNVLDNSVFGTATLTEDFKSRAYNDLPIHDVVFRSASATGTHVLYEGYGDGTGSFGDRLNTSTAPACALTEPIAHHASAGDLLSSGLCERTLFLNPADQNGERDSCGGQWDQAGVGPTWSVEQNDSCPLDDPIDSTFIRSFSSDSPWGNVPLQIWARESDFTAFGSAATCQAHRDLGRDIPGHYLVIDDDSITQQVFCLMLATGEGWMRVADLDAGHDNGCPGDWQGRVDPRACWSGWGNGQGASSAKFDALGLDYGEVRGYVRALQKGTTNAFFASATDIDGVYVDGVAISHGASETRTHIWTYAVAFNDVDTDEGICPCVGGNASHAFVCSDYHCDTARDTAGRTGWDIWHTERLLFDDVRPSTCYTGGDPAWFVKTLPSVTSNDLEVRIMLDQDLGNEAVGVVRLELYVR